ncbi:MAG: hypothetical protein ACPGR7_10305 [Flavobacteriaceae bacterium]
MCKGRIIYLLLPLLFIACQEEPVTDTPEQQTPPALQSRSLAVSFSIPSESQEHKYIYDGYTVLVYGENRQDELTDINLLNGPYEATISGDIYISIFHPDFESTAIAEYAYFGVSNQQISSGEEQVLIELELVQGFVLVESSDGTSDGINGISINDQAVELDNYYYTASPQVQVYVNTDLGILASKDPVEIGSGIRYEVDLASTSVDVSFPGFDDGVDGGFDDFIQPVILKKNVLHYSSYKLYNDGTVDLFTEDNPTVVFIPQEDLGEGNPIGSYDLEHLNLEWKVNTGNQDKDRTDYLNIYLVGHHNSNLEVKITDNFYIEVREVGKWQIIDSYGSLNKGNNPKAYDEFLEDYGNYFIDADWKDDSGAVGNFIWRADQGSGTIYVENYYLSIEVSENAVIDQGNLVGGIIVENDIKNGSVTVDTNNEACAVLVKEKDLLKNGLLENYNVATIINGIKVRWSQVSVESPTTSLTIYLRKGNGNSQLSTLTILADGSIYVDGEFYPTIEELLKDFGTYTVRTDYKEGQGNNKVTGNFVWRTGDKRGRFTVYSYHVIN